MVLAAAEPPLHPKKCASVDAGWARTAVYLNRFKENAKNEEGHFDRFFEHIFCGSQNPYILYSKHDCVRESEMISVCTV